MSHWQFPLQICLCTIPIDKHAHEPIFQGERKRKAKTFFFLLKCVKTAKLFHCSAQQKLRWLKILFPPASSVTGEKKLNPLFSFLLFRLNCFSKIISLLKRTFQVCFVPAEQKSQPSLLHGFPYRSEVNHSLICLKSSEEN